MTRTPKPGDRLLPKIPTESIVARIITESDEIYLTASEVRVVAMHSDNPEGTAVAMWYGVEENACFVDASCLEKSTYVFADEFDEITTSDVNEVQAGDFVVISRCGDKANYNVSGIVDKVEIGESVNRIHMGDSGVFHESASRRATYSIRRAKLTPLKPNSVVTPKCNAITATYNGHNFTAPIGLVSSDGFDVLADWDGPYDTPYIPVEGLDRRSIKEDNK